MSHFSWSLEIPLAVTQPVDKAALMQIRSHIEQLIIVDDHTPGRFEGAGNFCVSYEFFMQ